MPGLSWTCGGAAGSGLRGRLSSIRGSWQRVRRRRSPGNLRAWRRRRRVEPRGRTVHSASCADAWSSSTATHRGRLLGLRARSVRTTPSQPAEPVPRPRAQREATSAVPHRRHEHARCASRVGPDQHLRVIRPPGSSMGQDSDGPARAARPAASSRPADGGGPRAAWPGAQDLPGRLLAAQSGRWQPHRRACPDRATSQ